MANEGREASYVRYRDALLCTVYLSILVVFLETTLLVIGLRHLS